MELSRVRAAEATLPPDEHAASTDYRTLRFRFYAMLFGADTLSIVAGFVLAGLIRFGDATNVQALTMVAATFPLFCAFNVASYVPETLSDWRRGVGRPIAALLGALAIVLFLGFFLKASTELSRLMTVGGFVLSSALIVAGRAAIGWHTRRVFGATAISSVLLCDEVQVDAPADVRVIDSEHIGFTGDIQHPIVLDRLSRALDGADSVYIACAPERRAAWTSALQGSNRHVELLVPELSTLGVIGTRQFAGTPTVLISAGQMRTRDEVVKRALDLALVIPALLFLAPLLALVAVAIKLDSAGPVLFVQQRVGRGNRLFNVFKFRSMRTDECDPAGHVSASRRDSRVTRVGRFIRSTSIDELAQLFNILRGDMSFVGPRPHALGSLAGDALFWEVDHRYHHRHACKPGLTGLAQVRGFRGATHQREDLINRLRADLEYVNGWSVRRDLAILLATVKVVVYRDPHLADSDAPEADTPGAPTRRIGPVDIALTDRISAIGDVVDAVARRTGRVFAFCNMHTLNLARRVPALAGALDEATVFNDGVGIDMASRLLHGAPFPHNLNGTDLTPAVLGALDRPTRLFLIGSKPGIAERAAANLSSRFGNVVVVGTHHGFVTDMDSEALADSVRAAGADLLLLGMGNPRQEVWAAHHGARTGAVILCVGAFLDFTAGAVSRAPERLRNLRLEWAYRLMLEPRRMFRRYVIGGIDFVGTIALERLRGGGRDALPVAPAGNDNRPLGENRVISATHR